MCIRTERETLFGHRIVACAVYSLQVDAVAYKIHRIRGSSSPQYCKAVQAVCKAD